MITNTLRINQRFLIRRTQYSSFLTLFSSSQTKHTTTTTTNSSFKVTYFKHLEKKEKNFFLSYVNAENSSYEMNSPEAKIK